MDRLNDRRTEEDWMNRNKMERVGGREGKMEGHCSTGQSPQWAVVTMEGEGEGEEEEEEHEEEEHEEEEDEEEEHEEEEHACVN